jgi:midasin
MAIMKARREILSQSQHLASYVKKNLESLSEYRQRQRVFSKDGLITIRDLLKWTGREFIDKDNFMRDGFALLGERLRTEEEKKYV